MRVGRRNRAAYDVLIKHKDTLVLMAIIKDWESRALALKAEIDAICDARIIISGKNKTPR